MAFVLSFIGSTGVAGVTFGGEGSFARSELEFCTGFRGTPAVVVVVVAFGALTSRRTSGDDCECLCLYWSE